MVIHVGRVTTRANRNILKSKMFCNTGSARERSVGFPHHIAICRYVDMEHSVVSDVGGGTCDSTCKNKHGRCTHTCTQLRVNGFLCVNDNRPLFELSKQ